MARSKARPASVRDVRSKLESNLRRWIPNNDALVSRELAIFDQLALSRRDLLKLGSFAAVAALVSDGCGTPSTWTSDPSVTPSMMASAEGVANVQASADCLHGVTTYRTFQTVDASNLESVLEAFNPFPMVEDAPAAGGDSGFRPLDRTYGHPEIVHLSRDEQGRQVLSVNVYTHEHGLGLEETTLPLHEFRSKFGTLTTEYNRVVALNGPRHNTRDTDGMIVNQKMILAAVDYPLFFPDSDRDIRTWYDYMSEMGGNNELRQQLVLHYQYGAADPVVNGDDVPASPEEDAWKSINLVDHFKSWAQSGDFPLPFAKPFSDLAVVVRDVDRYQDGMGNAFLYGTVKVDYFSTFGFVVTFDQQMPEIIWFAPPETTTAGENSPMLAFLKRFYPSWDGEGSLDAAVNQETGLPREVIESDLYHQAFKPLAQPDDVNLVFAYRTLDTHWGPPCQIQIEPEGAEHDPMAAWRWRTVGVFLGGTGLQVPATEANPDWWRQIAVTRSASGTGPCTIEYSRGGSLLGDITEMLDPVGDPRLGEIFYPRAGRWGQGGTMEVIGHSVWYGDRKDVVLRTNKITFAWLDGETPVYYAKSWEHRDVSLEDDTAYRDLWFRKLNPDPDSCPTLSSWFTHSYFAGQQPEIRVSYNHQDHLRVLLRSTDSRFPYTVGWFEEPDREGLEQYGTVDIFARFDGGDLAFHPPMPLSYKAERLLPWNGYLHGGEFVMAAPRQKGVDPDSGKLGLLADTEGTSYLYGIQDHLENAWKLYELQSKVARPMQEITSEERVQALMHHIELQATNIYGLPVGLPAGAHIEVRTADSVQLLNLTDPERVKCVNLNRTVSYPAAPDSTGRVVLQIDLGHESDFSAGTSLYYRIVNASALSHHPDRPTLLLNAGDGDETTTGWKVFNISFAMHERMNTAHYGAAQVAGSDSPRQRIEANFSSRYASRKEEIQDQFKQGYDSLSRASRPANETALALHGASSDPIDPLTHVLALPGAAGSVQGFKKWWHWLNPVNWGKQAAKLAKKVLDTIIDKIKDVLDDILDSLAHLLDDLGLDGLANACRKLEAAIDTVLDAVKTLVDVVLDVLIGLFDFKKAQEIGQAVVDFLTNTLDSRGGTLALIRQEGDRLISSFTDALQGLEDDFAAFVNRMFGTAGAAPLRGDAPAIPWDNATAQNLAARSRENSVHTNHVMKQIFNNLPLSAAAAVPAGGRGTPLPRDIGDDIARLAAKFEGQLTQLFQDAIAGVEKCMTSGDFKGFLRDMLGLLQELLSDVIEDVETILRIALDSLTSIGGIVEDMLNLSLGFLGDFLTLLGRLFGGVKLEKASDIAALMVGFPFVACQGVIDAVAKAAGVGSVDILDSFRQARTLDQLFPSGARGKSVGTDLVTAGLIGNTLFSLYTGFMVFLRGMMSRNIAEGNIKKAVFDTPLVVGNALIMLSSGLMIAGIWMQGHPGRQLSFYMMIAVILITLLDCARIAEKDPKQAYATALFECILSAVLLGTTIFLTASGVNPGPAAQRYASALSYLAAGVNYLVWPLADSTEPDPVTDVGAACVTAGASLVTGISALVLVAT